jgi:hypothetical protein
MEITKKELEKMYKEKTNAECCEILGVSNVTFLTMISENGIEMKGKGNHKKYKVVGV